MSLFRFITQLMKDMHEQSAHLHWLLKIGYYCLSFIFLMKSTLKFLLFHLKPNIGNPEKLSICCGKRPECYEKNILVKNKPALDVFFVERGTLDIGCVIINVRIAGKNGWKSCMKKKWEGIMKLEKVNNC